jgi:hypothetical protein
MRIFKILSAILIVVFLLFITAYVVVITRNLTVSSSCWLFDWNPPPAEHQIPLALAYPETFIMSFPNGTLLMADMILTFNGELTENTLVHVENASCQLPPGQGMYLTGVVVGFEGAFLPNETSYIQQGYTWGGGTACVAFSSTQPILPNAWTNLTVFWENNVTFPVAGDYSPSISMSFDNGTLLQYTYTQIKVHVLSTSEVNAENTNRLNLGLTIALLGFSFIEGFMVIYELLKKEEPKTQPPQTPTTIIPETIKPPPTKSSANNTVSTNDQPTSVSDGENDRKKSNSESNTTNKPKQTNDQP